MPLDTLPVDILSCVFNYCTLVDRIELRYVNKRLRAAHIELYPITPLNGMLSALLEIATSAEYKTALYQHTVHFQPITIPDSNYNDKIVAQLENVVYNTRFNKRHISKYIDRLVVGLLYSKARQVNHIAIGRFKHTWGSNTVSSIINVEYIDYLLHGLLDAYLHELLTAELSSDTLYNLTKYLAMSPQITEYGYLITGLAASFRKTHIRTIISCIPSDIQMISKMLMLNYPSAHAFVSNVYRYRSDAHYMQVKQGIMQSLMYLNPDAIDELGITPEVVVKNVRIYNNILVHNYRGTFNGTELNSVEINIIRNIIYDLMEQNSEDVYNSVIAQGVNVDKEIELWCASDCEYEADMWSKTMNYYDRRL